ncbi:MAG: Peptidase rane alanine aminopeptidase [Streptosporangiaceae bacterium]|nr:Peptidase rane alanine aminopeptidase [Streptosporangiaceae bacterium]
MVSRRPSRMLPLAAAAVSVVLFAPAASAARSHGAAVQFTPGAPGVGDTYFQLEGNGGYDFQH